MASRAVLLSEKANKQSAELGQYNRAAALQLMPLFNFVGPLAEATLPLLARLRPRPDLYRRAYLDLVRNLLSPYVNG